MAVTAIASRVESWCNARSANGIDSFTCPGCMTIEKDNSRRQFTGQHLPVAPPELAHLQSLSGEMMLSRTLPETRLAHRLKEWRDDFCSTIDSVDMLRRVASRESRLIVFDTEYTSWEGAQQRKWSGTGEHREIFQIGAIQFNPFSSQDPISVLSLIIRPKLNPQISTYVSTLTGITPETVSTTGISFEEAILQLYTFADGGRIPLLSYGPDSGVLTENAQLCGLLPPPFEAKLYDILPLIRTLGVSTEKYVSGTLHQAFGIDLDLRVHNASDDCLSIVHSLLFLLQEQQ